MSVSTVQLAFLRAFVPSCEVISQLSGALKFGIFSHEGTKARRGRGSFA
jgi:hypothetical protein